MTHTTPPTLSAPVAAQILECDGACEIHSGAVTRVAVTRWGFFNYCGNAVETDRKNGFVVQRAPALLTPQAAPEGVPIPKNVNEAITMNLVSHDWLQSHAPERLKAPAPQAAPVAAPVVAEPTHWLVLAPCGEGVVFDNKADAKWTQTGRGDHSHTGTPVIGAAFRDSYEGKKFTLVPLNLAAARAPTTKQC